MGINIQVHWDAKPCPVLFSWLCPFFVDDKVEVETSILPELIAGMMSNL